MEVVLVPYQESWQKLFDEWSQRLKAQCKTQFVDVHHIGSTSIPGLAAKPVIDILAELENWEDLSEIRPLLEEIGFQEKFTSKIIRWAFYHHENPQIHLHVLCRGNPQIGRHLRFRDYLRTHPEDRDAYAKMKADLALKHTAKKEYTQEKTPFINSIDRKALSQYGFNHPQQLALSRTASTQELIEAMVANMALYTTYYAYYVPVCRPVQEKDLIGIVSDIDSDLFNYVFGAQFTDENASARMEEVKARFANLPFSWWVGPLDAPEDLERRLEEAGLHFGQVEQGMVCDLQSVKPTSGPLEIKRVLDHETFKLLDEVHIAGGGSKEAYDKVLSKIPLELYGEGSPIRCYLGFVQGKPVATGIMVSYAGVAGIYYIMTHPDHRLKGYATQLLQMLLNEARKLGYAFAVLQANPRAQGVYEGVGFTSICEFREYTQCASNL